MSSVCRQHLMELGWQQHARRHLRGLARFLALRRSGATLVALCRQNAIRRVCWYYSDGSILVEPLCLCGGCICERPVIPRSTLEGLWHTLEATSCGRCLSVNSLVAGNLLRLLCVLWLQLNPTVAVLARCIFPPLALRADLTAAVSRKPRQKKIMHGTSLLSLTVEHKVAVPTPAILCVDSETFLGYSTLSLPRRLPGRSYNHNQQTPFSRRRCQTNKGPRCTLPLHLMSGGMPGPDRGAGHQECKAVPKLRRTVSRHTLLRLRCGPIELRCGWCEFADVFL